MIGEMLASRYARALLEAAVREKALDKITQDFRDFIALISDCKDLENALTSPSISPVSRRKILDRICSEAFFHNIFRRFLLLLNEKGRIKYLSGIFESYKEQLDKSRGILTVKLSYAGSLEKKQVEKINKTLQGISSKKEVKIDIKEDESLIGGVKVEMAGTIYDGTIKNKIQMLKKLLTGE